MDFFLCPMAGYGLSQLQGHFRDGDSFITICLSLLPFYVAFLSLIVQYVFTQASMYVGIDLVYTLEKLFFRFLLCCHLGAASYINLRTAPRGNMEYGTHESIEKL